MAQILKATTHDIGGLTVSRLLPHMRKRMVGPFIFFDHMGPTHFPAGQGVEVQPHPHIGLSTLTYLFEGRILHRDSLGNKLEIAPGDVNWMTAGSGIVHSERESFEVRGGEHAINGLQSWVALPEQYSDIDPSFEHIGRHDLPQITHNGVMTRVIAGEAYGLNSPITTYSEMFYVDIIAPIQRTITVPNPGQETALYVIFGEVTLSGTSYSPGQLVLLDHEDTYITTTRDTRMILLGGDKWESVPYIHWNFISFSKARIEQAKHDWREGNFPSIPDDDREYVPLPASKPKAQPLR
ncbi:pirin family protein [Pseudoalteromonas luteoviolacea]|uniref:Pirin n=1 Tax=Pseudoalteromonas luteoviolacea H33 TaxID=1365251 RepID=A0A167E019_9GAMM|nr:pirin family protein [Pseudoalteromonas luteoviolacea]KZN49819.1 hypothetical protein N476_18675 [Pseudoalteromonas luteoviolacea H33]KZN77843.1 hypothetical protein N477_01130 [Pseudoalteromonas luteoviolacea H33-S]MBQ4879452.1 pirin family protein [Pseudoalteromonas luteoviolacea]MBQ4908512.1 pirin family protein [Pseudoalteromonas luteoviolacea]